MRYFIPFLLSGNAFPVSTFVTQIPSQASSIKAQLHVHGHWSSPMLLGEAHQHSFPQSHTLTVPFCGLQHTATLCPNNSSLIYSAAWAAVPTSTYHTAGTERGQHYWTTKLFQKALALTHLSSLQNTWVPPMCCKTVRLGMCWEGN